MNVPCRLVLPGVQRYDSLHRARSRVRFRPGDPQCYQEGTVGWCADRACIILPNGTQQLVRLTAVFRREGDSWKLVHSHASFGVPNADALGTDLTT